MTNRFIPDTGQLIREAKQSYENYLVELRNDALKSIGRTFLIAAPIPFVFYSSLLGVRYSQHKIEAFLSINLVTLGLGVAAWISADDAQKDWKTYTESNSSAIRSKLISNLLEQQNAGVSDVAALWVQRAKIKADVENKRLLAELKEVKEQKQLLPVAAPPEMPYRYHDPARDLGKNLQSAIIAGVPGAGKDFFASNALVTAKEANPGLYVLFLDLKCDPKEANYYKDAAEETHSFRIQGCDPDEFAQWYIGELDYFSSLPSPKLLIIGEGTSLALGLQNANPSLKAWKRHLLFIGNISSMGDSLQEYLWILAQTVDTKSMGLSSGFRSIFRAIAILNPKNLHAVNAFLRTGFVPYPESGMDELRSLMEQSECNRAYFDGKIGQWLPMPRMQNLSGYDRDARAHLPTQAGQQITPQEDTILKYLGRLEVPIVDRERLRNTMANSRYGIPKREFQSVLNHLVEKGLISIEGDWVAAQNQAFTQDFTVS